MSLWKKALALGVALSVSAGVGLVLLEVVLRMTRAPSRFYPYHPSTSKVFYPNEELTPGVSGVSYFTVNRFGCRGPELGGEAVRILVLGGSTAADTLLDDGEAWPQRLMDALNRRAGRPDFAWVTNAAIDGLNSRHHLMHAQHLLPELPRLDWVLVYAGLNDMGLWLYDRDYHPDALERAEVRDATIGKAFRLSNYARPDEPAFKGLELYKGLARLKAALETRRVAAMKSGGAHLEDERLAWLASAQQRRQEIATTLVPAAKEESLPLALGEYERNLGAIARHIRAAGAEPVFVAQAIAWRDLSEEEKRRLWMGAMDGGAAYANEEQVQGFVERFNETMRSVAAAEGATFVDLSALLAGAGQLYYDGCHFNEEGARVVGERLAEALYPLLEALGAEGRR